jgi:hypothetical protein
MEARDLREVWWPMLATLGQLEVGEHQGVERLGAGSRADGLLAGSARLARSLDRGRSSPSVRPAGMPVRLRRYGSAACAGFVRRQHDAEPMANGVAVKPEPRTGPGLECRSRAFFRATQHPDEHGSNRPILLAVDRSSAKARVFGLPQSKLVGDGGYGFYGHDRAQCGRRGYSDSPSPSSRSRSAGRCPRVGEAAPDRRGRAPRSALRGDAGIRLAAVMLGLRALT